MVETVVSELGKHSGDDFVRRVSLELSLSMGFVVTQDRGILELAAESFPSILAVVVEVKRNVFTSQGREGTANTAVILDKTAVEVAETEKALDASHVLSIFPFINYRGLLRVNLNPVDSDDKPEKFGLRNPKLAFLDIGL